MGRYCIDTLRSAWLNSMTKKENLDYKLNEKIWLIYNKFCNNIQNSNNYLKNKIL